MKNTYSQAAWKHLSVKWKRYWSQKAPISLLFPSLYCFQQFLGNCFQGHAKLDPRDCNNYIPVVLTFSFVPQAAEDRQGAICYVRWPLASCELWRLLFWHATVYFWANFVKSEAIIVILEKDNGKIMSIYWSYTVTKFKHNITGNICKSLLIINFLYSGYHIFLTSVLVYYTFPVITFVSHALLIFSSNLKCFASFSSNC